MNKREFLKTSALAGIAANPFISNLEKWLDQAKDSSPNSLAKDEKFWRKIRKHYKLKDDYINLESGYYCMLPEATLERQIKYLRFTNLHASYYMRKMRDLNKKKIHQKLATLAGCDVSEIALTRNTTESLDTIIGGIKWKVGDEAVMAVHDYGAMLNQFKLMGQRYGVVNKKVVVPLHPKSDEEIVKVYQEAITEKTRLLMVCHMINITGQILPIKKICDMAHAHGVEVMVDGAHSFAHLDFNIPDLGCDYFGSSLHKWLSAPLGTGLLYVKSDKIKNIWPLLMHYGEKDDIMKLNHTGTNPVHIDLAVSDALDFHYMLGSARKEARLRYVQRYWSDQIRNIPNIIVNTPNDPTRSCGIANVGIKDMHPKDMANILMNRYKIWTVGINNKEVSGCRITPNVFTSTKELDRFVVTLKEMAGV